MIASNPDKYKLACYSINNYYDSWLHFVLVAVRHLCDDGGSCLPLLYLCWLQNVSLFTFLSGHALDYVQL